MDVRLQSRDQTAKWGMAHVMFCSSEVSTHEQIQDENHDYCFFCQPLHCAQRIFTARTQLITPSTKMSWNDFENRSSDSEGTLQTIGCCSTITRQLTLRFQFENFWRRKTFPNFHILPTAQIWHHAISTSSLILNRIWRVVILGQWETYRK